MINILFTKGKIYLEIKQLNVLQAGLEPALLLHDYKAANSNVKTVLDLKIFFVQQ